MTRRRLAAAAALLLGALTVAFAISVMLREFPRGVTVLITAAIAARLVWEALLRRGAARNLLAAGAGVFLALTVALLIVERRVVDDLIVIAGVMGTLALARIAFTIHVPLARVTPPSRPVLIYNPLSGGGKAERFSLADEARARGIEPIAFQPPGDDLATLVEGAIAGGADALAMAGGDGSQAVVAAAAAAHDLPYACIPAGTRNHFALDLGVDREDVVGALDAFTDGGERRVDLAEVNGRVFVNNVSLGLYAEAVQRKGYRERKLRTMLEMVPDVMGREAPSLDLRWRGPNGHDHDTAAVILVSNNVYLVGRMLGSGTRPRIDDGLLGIVVVRAGRDQTSRVRAWRQWSATTFEVGSGAPVPSGVDGEALLLEAPLRFAIRPGALRVRIARAHPGASPSAAQPLGLRAGAVTLARIAAGRPVSLQPGALPPPEDGTAELAAAADVSPPPPESSRTG